MPNTIAQNLQRLQTARTDIANAITTMGGTVTSGDGFEDFPAEILGIPVGSGDIQFSHTVGYTSSSSSYTTNSVNVYNPSSCFIVGYPSSDTGYIDMMVPIITTSSNVFICLPVYINLKSSATNASISYRIPSSFPSTYGYNPNTRTLYSYYKFTFTTTGSCTASASTINFSVGAASSNIFFGDFIFKFDKT